MDESIEHAAEVEAAVNQPSVTLYDDAGRAINVLAGDEAHWLAHGFSRETVDLDAALAELPVLARTVEEAYRTVIAEARAAGGLRSREQAAFALRAATDELAGCLHRLNRGIFLAFPVVQEEE